jgi:hypothetical protein
MRALPADSLEYFGDTAVGNTALPAAAGAVLGSAAFLFEVGAAAGPVFVGAGVAAGAAALAAQEIGTSPQNEGTDPARSHR